MVFPGMIEGMRTRSLVYGFGSAAIGVVAASGMAAMGVATVFARRLLTPDVEREDDARIVACDEQAGTVTLAADPQAKISGKYGLWLQKGAGHVRVEEIIASNADGQVVRQISAVDGGPLSPGPARWNGYYFTKSPGEAFGCSQEKALIPGELGGLPTWVVPARADREVAPKAAVLVHGRGATREECLRAVPVLKQLGYTVYIPAYRNDGEAPPSSDGRYTLGLTEWKDIEQVCAYAVQEGAQELAVMGWSMGGAIVLQLLDRSRFADLITRVVLDAPVISWMNVMEHHARENRVPAWLGGLAQKVMGSPLGSKLLGISAPLPLSQADWLQRSGDLTHKMLIVHSLDDEFVPVGPSQELAQLRPDLVTFLPWQDALHCREWNTDPHTWEAALRRYLRHGGLSASYGRG